MTASARASSLFDRQLSEVGYNVSEVSASYGTGLVEIFEEKSESVRFLFVPLFVFFSVSFLPSFPLFSQVLSLVANLAISASVVRFFHTLLCKLSSSRSL